MPGCALPGWVGVKSGTKSFAMLGYILSSCLALILIAVSTLSIQLATLAWVRVSRPRPSLPMAQLRDEELPHVLVQLPVCNEGYLALRVAAAACALDWPKGRLTIQILDDGTEENHAALAAGLVGLAPEGVNLQHAVPIARAIRPRRSSHAKKSPR